MGLPDTRIEASAGGVVVREVAGEPHVLLIRDPYKKWALPKGRGHEGESLSETALREVSEETGLGDLELGPELLTIDWTFHVEGERVHKYATFYLMYSHGGDPVPEAREGISDAKWVRLKTADEAVSYENATEVVKVAQRELLAPDPSGPPAAGHPG